MQLDIQLTIVFVHETIAFALIFTSEWASPAAVCIIELSPKFEYVLFFTSDLIAHQEAQQRVYSSLPWTFVVSPVSPLFGECGATNVSARGECAGECADQLEMNSIRNECWVY